MSTAPEIVGQLHDTKFWATKKITEWKYESSLTTDSPLIEKLGPPVAVVNLETVPTSERKRLKDTVEDTKAFVARSSWFKRNDIWDASLEGLEKKVEQAFRDQIIAHSKVKWSDWLEVKVDGRQQSTERDERSEGYSGLTVHRKLLKRARFPDGRDMVLDGTTLYKFPQAKAAGVDRDRFGGSRDYYQDSDDQYSYIPATTENMAAVDAVLANISKLRLALEGVLEQKSIIKELATLAPRLEFKPTKGGPQ